MLVTIAKVLFIPENNQFKWWILNGIVVAMGHGGSIEKPNVVQSGFLGKDRWKYVFGSNEKAEILLKEGYSLTRKVRLTTLGYDRSDRVLI